MKALARFSRRHPERVLVVVALVAVVGTVLLLSSRAASPYASHEVETGTLNGPTQQTDSTASAGKYVKFGSIPTTPPPSGGICGTSVGQPAYDGSADKGLPGIWSDNQREGDTVTSVVTAPSAYNYSGHKAFQFKVNAGGTRAELAGLGPNFGEGADLWFGDVLYIPRDPNEATNWPGSHNTLTQFKNTGTGSPPLELNFHRTGGLQMFNNQESTGNSIAATSQTLIPASQIYNGPFCIEIHVHFSKSASTGFYQVYINGQAKPQVNTFTLFSGSGKTESYFKEGLYGDATGNVVYWLGAKRGPTRESVLR